MSTSDMTTEERAQRLLDDIITAFQRAFRGSIPPDVVRKRAQTVAAAMAVGIMLEEDAFIAGAFPGDFCTRYSVEMV